jgi:V8-like Glu-specific endopeptidase
MKQKLLRSTQTLMIFFLIAVFLLGAAGERGKVIAAAPASVPAAAVQEGNISVKSDPAGVSWKAATRPWTTERMLAAKPLDIITLEGEPAMSIDATAAESEFGVYPSALPGDFKQPLAKIQDLELDSFAAPLGYSYPAPFTRFWNFAKYTRFPYSTVGVLFFSIGAGDYRCSAASIGNYAVWTAGHCVHSGNGAFSGWATDVTFIPAYRNGAAPYGVWTAANIWTTGGWYDDFDLYDDGGDLRVDMGGAVLNVNGAAQKISTVVGNLGFTYGLTRVQHWTDIGYPSAPPFTGANQQICLASHAYNDYSLGAPEPMAIGCDLTGGSSGGPWILSFSGLAGATDFVNGHNSYRYTVNPKEMFSPYFGGTANGLYTDLITDAP